MTTTTPHFSIPKPMPSNHLSDDVVVLQQAMDLIDAALKAGEDLAGQKAPLNHSHSMSQVTGLNDALALKMPANKTFALADLTDIVGVSSVPNGHVLSRYDGQFSFRSVLSVLGDHEHAMSQVTGLTSALNAKANLAGASFTGPITVLAPTESFNPATKKYVDDLMGTSTSVDWAAITNKPTAYAPTAHGHTIQELTHAPSVRCVVGRTGTSGTMTAIPLAPAGTAVSGSIPAYATGGRLAVGTPSNGTDATTKAYTDEQRDTRISKTGDTFSGEFSSASSGRYVNPTGATLTPSAANGHMQDFTAPTTAWTFNAPVSTATDYDMEVAISNPATTAGTMTPSGYDFVDRSALTTAANAKFIAFIRVRGARKTLRIAKDS